MNDRRGKREQTVCTKYDEQVALTQDTLHTPCLSSKFSKN